MADLLDLLLTEPDQSAQVLVDRDPSDILPFAPAVLQDAARVLTTYGAGCARACLIKYGVPLNDLEARLKDVQAAADFEDYDTTPVIESTIDASPTPGQETAELIAWLRKTIKQFLESTPPGRYLPPALLQFDTDTPISELHAIRQQLKTVQHAQEETHD